MGALLESGLVGNIGLKHLKVIKEDTINKWDKLGFLDDLKGHLKENVAQLYENLPIGKLFYFIPKIQGYNAATANGGEHFQPIGAPGSTTDVNSGYNDGNAYSKNLYDLFYEGAEPGLDPAGLFDYSKGTWTAVTATAITQVWNGSTLVDGTTNLTGNQRKVIIKLSGFSNVGDGKLIGPDGHEMDTETFLSDLKVLKGAGITVDAASPCALPSSTPLLFRVVTQKYGKGIVQYGAQEGTTFGTGVGNSNGGSFYNICDATGVIYLEVDLSCPACVGCGADTLDGYTGTTISALTAATAFSATYRRYKELEFEDKIGEVSFDLESVTVSVTERKLRAQWSPELAQDVAAFHNIDAEAELTALLSEQVAAEIDREILRDLRKGAAWNLRWDYNGWRRVTNLTTSYTQKDWNQTLITAINQLSAQIHKSTLRGGANWIVVSSEVSAIFDDLEYFHVSNASPEQDQYNMGIERVGTLAGRYQVYRDPYFPPNTILLGHKGTSLLDTGYIYAPYVPLQLTPTMYNPFNFTPIKGIMTRYAKKMVNNRFYARITVDGVRTFDLRELR